MTLSIFNLPIWVNYILMVLIVALLLFLFLIQRKLVKKYQENIKQWKILLIYLADLILFFCALVGILFLWEFDFSVFTTNFLANLETLFVTNIGSFIGTIVIMFAYFAITKVAKLAFLRVGTKQGPTQKRKKTIAKVTQSIIKYVVGIIAILGALALWGVNVLPALAGLGIAGLVIGFGAQKFINDLISGFFIIFEQHFDVGDIIEVDGFKGEVTDIGLKTTKIRNWKGEVKIFPNGSASPVTNFSRNPSTAIIEFGIAYKEDIEKTIAILRAELPKLKNEVAEIIEEPQVMGVIELANSGVNLRVIVKTMTEKHYAVERLTRQRIKEILDANNIEIPFPQVVVHKPKAD